jgi:hypothetical protein
MRGIRIDVLALALGLLLSTAAAAEEAAWAGRADALAHF